MFKNLSTAALGVSGSQSEVIELVLSNGFKGMDLDLVEFNNQVQLRGLPQSRRLLDSAKLRLGCFSLPVAWQGSDEDFQRDLGRLPATAQLAKDLGCTRAVTTLDPASDERPYHQNFEFSRKRLAELGTALEPLGISLGVGFLAPGHHRAGKAFEFVSTFDVLSMLLGMIGRANVGYALDLWHMHLCGAGVDSIRKLKPQQIVAVALADAPADLDPATCTEESRLLPGASGTIPAAAALTVLAELGYDGPVTAAPHPKQFAGQRRDQIVKQTGQALDAVWKAAGLNTAGKLTVTTAK